MDRERYIECINCMLSIIDRFRVRTPSNAITPSCDEAGYYHVRAVIGGIDIRAIKGSEIMEISDEIAADFDKGDVYKNRISISRIARPDMWERVEGETYLYPGDDGSKYNARDICRDDNGYMPNLIEDVCNNYPDIFGPQTNKNK